MVLPRPGTRSHLGRRFNHTTPGVRGDALGRVTIGGDAFASFGSFRGSRAGGVLSAATLGPAGLQPRDVAAARAVPGFSRGRAPGRPVSRLVPVRSVRHALPRAGRLRRPAYRSRGCRPSCGPRSALSLQTLCAVALAGLGAWLFARVLGAAPVGCATAAVSYALSGYSVAATDNIVFLWERGAPADSARGICAGGPARLVAGPAGRRRARERPRRLSWETSRARPSSPRWRC